MAKFFQLACDLFDHKKERQKLTWQKLMDQSQKTGQISDKIF